MTPAEATSLKAALASMAAAYPTGSLIQFYFSQWRDDVNAEAYAYTTAEESANRDPGGILVCTVAGLPTAVSAGNGAEAIVTDATVATNGGVVAGGGSTRVLVRSNATNWLIV